MTYQALARKWRPGSFTEIVGQQHVVSALTHALDHDRVHHAFLFTGTRGVGKTTLARILAKCLNCEQGVSSQPCNQCSACQSIDEGRFVDLIEVDAASRTKVEDTRELLDNVQYAPTRGRYKVYLIDEVHMLSGHSFNALLKTLEEPPPHVKFLLATTDPKKVPITVLSRCIQFSLKMLPWELISGQLAAILDAEQIAFEPTATDMLARSAKGSMRDGLSLLDQAIAQGGGRVSEDVVRQMLGLIDNDSVHDMIDALIRKDATELFSAIQQTSDTSCDYAQLSEEILTTLYHLALYQENPALLEAKQIETEWYEKRSKDASREDVQLFYQMCLVGKQDINLAPDPRTGFEMMMLRLLAFRPVLREDLERNDGGVVPAQSGQSDSTPKTTGEVRAGVVGTQAPDWRELVKSLKLESWTLELAMNLALDESSEDRWILTLDPSHEHLLTDARKSELEDSISKYLDQAIKTQIRVAPAQTETPADQGRREADDVHRKASDAIKEDSGVQSLMERFDATLVEDTIRSTQK